MSVSAFGGICRTDRFRVHRVAHSGRKGGRKIARVQRSQSVGLYAGGPAQTNLAGAYSEHDIVAGEEVVQDGVDGGALASMSTEAHMVYDVDDDHRNNFNEEMTGLTGGDIQYHGAVVAECKEEVGS